MKTSPMRGLDFSRQLRVWGSLLLTLCLASLLSASAFTVSVPSHSIFNSPVPVGAVDGLNAAFAGRGTVGAEAFAFAEATNVHTGNAKNAAASATTVVDDLIFTGPAATLQTRFRYGFNGVFSLHTQGIVDSQGIESLSTVAEDVELFASVGCSNCAAILSGALHVHADSTALPPSILRQQQSTQDIELTSNMVLPLAGSINGIGFTGVDKTLVYGMVGAFDSGIVQIPTGVPITMSLTIQGSSAATANYLASGSGFWDFQHTLGLPQGVPAFDLPPGFTANAPSIGLVNNIIAIPEPASLESLEIAAVAYAAFAICPHGRQKH